MKRKIFNMCGCLALGLLQTFVMFQGIFGGYLMKDMVSYNMEASCFQSQIIVTFGLLFV